VRGPSQCVKCGAEWNGGLQMRQGDAFSGPRFVENWRGGGDVLEYTCRDCGYVVRIPTLDRAAEAKP
jgi:hypothetical protein